MNRKEQIALIRKSISEWNKWRKKNREIIPDLSGADLSGMDLKGVDFYLVGLHKTDLSGSDLGWVDFRYARMTEINFKDADLRNSKWPQFKTEFMGNTMDFSGADMRGARVQLSTSKTIPLERYLETPLRQ